MQTIATTVEVKNIEGKKVEELKLSPEVFGMERNDALIHQVYLVHEANCRQVIAHTKTRGERAGSGRKPWKQKGTGRARVGSVRSPIWRKGGVTFGPTNERNFSKRINKKMNQQAIKMVLSGKLADKELVVVDTYSLKDNKTKEMAVALKNLEIKGRCLMAFTGTESKAMLASRNLEKAENIMVDKLNVLDMLNRKYLVISKEGVAYLEDKYGKQNEAKVKNA
jgi:large subunit ribosomal protein L4